MCVCILRTSNLDPNNILVIVQCVSGIFLCNVENLFNKVLAKHIKTAVFVLTIELLLIDL